MGAFPALPSGNNSAITAAEGAARSAASIYERSESRTQAAARQEAARKLKEKEDTAKAGQQEYTNVVNAIGKGGLLANLQQEGDRGAANQADRSVTLQMPMSNPAIPENGQGQRAMTPAGTSVYFPTDLEKGKELIPAGQLGAVLQAGGAWDGKTPMTAAHSHQAMQALNEVAKMYADEGFEINTSGKFFDKDGNAVPVAIGKKSHKVTALDLSGLGGGAAQQPPAAPMGAGLPGGPFAAPAQPTAQAPAATAPMGAGSPNGPFRYNENSGHYELVGGAAQPAAQAPATAPAVNGSPGGPFAGPPTQAPAQQPTATPASGALSFKLPEKEPKAPRTRVDLTNFNQPVSVNEDTNEITPMKLPPGVSRAMSPAAVEADKDRHARMAEMGDAAASRKDAASQRVQNELARHNDKLGDRKETAKKDFLRAIKDAENDANDPDAAKKEAAQTYKQDLQKAQTEYETNIGTTLQKPVAHNAWADQIDPATLPGVAPKQTKGGNAAPNRNDPAGVRAKKPDPLGIR